MDEADRLTPFWTNELIDKFADWILEFASVFHRSNTGFNTIQSYISKVEDTDKRYALMTHFYSIASKKPTKLLGMVEKDIEENKQSVIPFYMYGARFGLREINVAIFTAFYTSLGHENYWGKMLEGIQKITSIPLQMCCIKTLLGFSRELSNDEKPIVEHVLRNIANNEEAKGLIEKWNVSEFVVQRIRNHCAQIGLTTIF